MAVGTFDIASLGLSYVFLITLISPDNHIDFLLYWFLGSKYFAEVIVLDNPDFSILISLGLSLSSVSAAAILGCPLTLHPSLPALGRIR